MRIGFRTVKTAVGVSLSVLIAQWLQLEYYSAAGILTLLCIQKSRKQSIKAATSRFFACMMGLFFATGLFELVGYRPYAFLILLLLFIPLCVRLRIQEGIASSSVIVMHVYINREVEASFFLNELLVVIVGLGVALLINWYMPSIDKQLRQSTVTERPSRQWDKRQRGGRKSSAGGRRRRSAGRQNGQVRFGDEPGRYD